MTRDGLIKEFTDNKELQTMLTCYFNDQKIYDSNRTKKKLKALNALSKDDNERIDIVAKSYSKRLKGFYAINKKKKGGKHEN